MTDLEPTLVAAYEARDVDEAGRLLEKWHALRRSAKLARDAIDQPRIAEIDAWLTETSQQRRLDETYRDTLIAIEHALDEHHPMDRLERQWAQLVKLEKPIPRILQQRYEARLREAQVWSARRFRLRVMIIAATLLLVTGVVVGAVIYTIDVREQRDWADRIEAAVDDHRLNEATALIAQLREQKPTLWQRPRFQSLQGQLDEAVELERQRAERFNAAMDAAEQAGPESPDRDALRLAGQLTRTDVERGRLDVMQQRVRQHELQRQIEHDRALSDAISDVRTRFADARRLATARDLAALPMLRNLHRELGSLTRDMDRDHPVIAAAEPMAESMRSLIETLEALAQRTETMERSLRTIQSLYNQPARLEQQLRAFVETYPEHPRAGDFARAAGLVSANEHMESWRESFAGIAAGIQVRTQAAALEQIQRLEAFLEAHPESPYRADAQQYMDYLRRARTALDAVDGPNSPNGALNRLLNHPAVASIYMLPDAHGHRYYTLTENEPRPWGEGVILLEFVTSVEEARGERRPRSREFDRSQFGSDITPRPSPQMAFRREALEANRNLAWETRHVQLLGVLHKHTEVDPVLRLMIAKELVRLSLRFDAVEVPELAEWGRRADQVTTDATWMDPASASGRAAREAASQQLELLPTDIEALVASMHRSLDQLRGRLSPRRPTALLWRDAAGDDHFVAGLDIRGSATLEAARRGDHGWELVKVGEVRDGRVTLADAARQFPAGTVLYLGGEGE